MSSSRQPLVAAFIGLRKSELLGLRRRDVDTERLTITGARQRQLDRNGRDLIGPPKTEPGGPPTEEVEQPRNSNSDSPARGCDPTQG